MGGGGGGGVGGWSRGDVWGRTGPRQEKKGQRGGGGGGGGKLAGCLKRRKTQIVNETTSGSV